MRHAWGTDPPPGVLGQNKIDDRLFSYLGQDRRGKAPRGERAPALVRLKQIAAQPGGTLNLANYFQTLRHIKPVQVYGLLLSLWPWKPRTGGVETQVQPVTGVWSLPIESPSFQTGADSFQFVGGDFDANGSSRWEDPRLSKLWLYNFHYFDDLNAVGAAARRDWHRSLVVNWITQNPPGLGTGWEPYPTACRIVNWVKWSLRGERLSDDVRVSLALQARYLRRNLEWRLLGNHLFADFKALLFVGCYFRGKEAYEWRRLALTQLKRQIAEQILPDGGHCEQSPMYHTIVLADLLDLINLGGAYPHLVPASEVKSWVYTCQSMFAWLASMCHPDGGTSFFSDGGFASFRTDALWEYARRLGIQPETAASGRLSHLKQSGYVRMETPKTVIIFDVGEIGPEYQPGHGHADVLSFELSHLGRRVLVNPGTSTYSEGPERQWQRSTAAHNTVEMDGQDQSELWSAFRVARRAHPIEVRTEDRDGLLSAECAHDGYRRLRAPVIHRRRIELSSDLVRIVDSLEGKGRHEAKLWFHLHPDVSVRGNGGGFVIGSEDGDARIEFDRRLHCSIEKCAYNPRFGVSQPNLAICASWSGSCPASFITQIALPAGCRPPHREHSPGAANPSGR